MDRGGETVLAYAVRQEEAASLIPTAPTPVRVLGWLRWSTSSVRGSGAVLGPCSVFALLHAPERGAKFP